MFTNKIITLPIVLASIIAITAIASTLFLTQQNPAALVGTYAEKTTFAHPLYAANYADNSILLGASHNVFVGKVIAQAGNKELAGSPTTQFSVDVIANMKGDIKDTVVVNQLGGYRDGTLYLMDEESKLLEIGSTYLFATRYNAEDDTYTLNSHPNASKLLSTDAGLSKKDLKDLSDQDEKVKTLEAAYPDEKLLDADIAHGNTRNEFKSLPEEKKTEARSRADAAKASLTAQHQ